MVVTRSQTSAGGARPARGITAGDSSGAVPEGARASEKGKGKGLEERGVSEKTKGRRLTVKATPSESDLACFYAGLVLFDVSKPITHNKITKLLRAAKVKCDKVNYCYSWRDRFSIFRDESLDSLTFSVGIGGASARDASNPVEYSEDLKVGENPGRSWGWFPADDESPSEESDSDNDGCQGKSEESDSDNDGCQGKSDNDGCQGKSDNDGSQWDDDLEDLKAGGKKLVKRVQKLIYKGRHREVLKILRDVTGRP